MTICDAVSTHPDNLLCELDLEHGGQFHIDSNARVWPDTLRSDDIVRVETDEKGYVDLGVRPKPNMTFILTMPPGGSLPVADVPGLKVRDWVDELKAAPFAAPEEDQCCSGGECGPGVVPDGSDWVDVGYLTEEGLPEAEQGRVWQQSPAAPFTFVSPDGTTLALEQETPVATGYFQPQFEDEAPDPLTVLGRQLAAERERSSSYRQLAALESSLVAVGVLAEKQVRKRLRRERQIGAAVGTALAGLLAWRWSR